MPFLGQEGHVLRARKACSEMLSRPFCNREGHEEGKGGEGAELSGNPDHSVLLCSSVRKRTHPRYEITHKQLAGEVFLSRWEGFSLTERTEFTEVFGAHFEPTERLRHTEVTERYC